MGLPVIWEFGGAYPGFCSMKQLEVFLLPLDGMLTHLYARVERGTVRIKCLAQRGVQVFATPGYTRVYSWVYSWVSQGLYYTREFMGKIGIINGIAGPLCCVLCRKKKLKKLKNTCMNRASDISHGCSCKFQVNLSNPTKFAKTQKILCILLKMFPWSKLYESWRWFGF